MTIGSLALLLVLVQAPPNPPQQQTPTAKASIEGAVLRSGSGGEPLARAQVTLTRIMPPPPPPQPGQPTAPFVQAPQIPAVMTESDGKFIFRNLEPGQYRISAKRNGYAMQEYGQKTPTAPVPPMTLTEGQQLKDVVFRLTAAAIVTGRVRDTNGEPIPAATVSLLRSSYNVSGQRSLSIAGSATTDDRGDYRVFWVPAGRYFASVSPGSEISSILGINQGVFSDRNFPVTYYPGTLDSSRATGLEIQPGAELSAIDFVVAQPGTFKLRGRVIDATTGKPPSSVSITLGPRQPQPATTGIIFTGSTSNVTYNSADGSFEMRNVIPGAYWLRGTGSSGLDQPINPALVSGVRTASELLNSVMSSRTSAQMEMDVTGSDIEGIVMTLTAGINIPLRLIADDRELSSIGGLDGVRVMLRPTATGANNAFQRSTFSPEGTAILDGVAAGEYRVQVSMGIPEFYVKEATFDRNDVLSSPWQITGQTSGTLNIVIRGKAGQIEGNLSDALSQPARASTVVLIPDQGRDRPELYRTAVTDQNGRYTLSRITPGGYKLFAWESLEPNAFYDRDVLSQYESQGIPVRVQESAKETVNLKWIPASK